MPLLLVAIGTCVHAYAKDCDAVLARFVPLAHDCYSERNAEEAFRYAFEIVATGCGRPEEAIFISSTLTALGNLTDAEAWAEAAVLSTPDTTEHPWNLRFFWAETLFRLGRFEDARREFNLAHQHRAFQENFSLEADTWPTSSLEVMEEFLSFAAIFPASNTSAGAYRRAAATVALRLGFSAASSYSYNDAIAAFSIADSVFSIDQQPTRTQMTVLRTLAIAHAYRGEPAPAIFAAESLLRLCDYTPGRRCDEESYVPFPLVGPQVGSNDREAIVRGHNLQAVAYALVATFESVSWDHKTGFRREGAKSADFFGDKTPEGYPYGMSNPEEDRVEALREFHQIMDSKDKQVSLLASTRAEPIIKVAIAALSMVVQTWSFDAPAGRFLAGWFDDVRAAVKDIGTHAGLAPTTREAFVLAERIDRVLRNAEGR